MSLTVVHFIGASIFGARLGSAFWERAVLGRP